jgi:hypothetical protein
LKTAIKSPNLSLFPSVVAVAVIDRDQHLCTTKGDRLIENIREQGGDYFSGFSVAD